MCSKGTVRTGQADKRTSPSDLPYISEPSTFHLHMSSVHAPCLSSTSLLSLFLLSANFAHSLPTRQIAPPLYDSPVIKESQRSIKGASKETEDKRKNGQKPTSQLDITFSSTGKLEKFSWEGSVSLSFHLVYKGFVDKRIGIVGIE